MVAIDGPFSGDERARGSAELAVKLRSVFARAARLPLLLFRRTDAEHAAKAQRIAQQVSLAAGQASAIIVQEPARLTPQAMSLYLDGLCDIAAEQARAPDVSREEILTQLDAIDYEFAAIRTDIADYLPR
ncbi:MAG: hypothetical protein AAFZ01_01350 [Pseudomonadota bacterium]